MESYWSFDGNTVHNFWQFKRLGPDNSVRPIVWRHKCSGGHRLGEQASVPERWNRGRGV